MCRLSWLDKRKVRGWEPWAGPASVQMGVLLGRTEGSFCPPLFCTGPWARIGPGQYRRALYQGSSLVHCGLPQTRLVQIGTINTLTSQMRKLRFRGLSDLAKSY